MSLGLILTVLQKRAAMLASRSKDPGVIVDVPQEPTAEEVEAARKADALVAREAVQAEGVSGVAR